MVISRILLVWALFLALTCANFDADGSYLGYLLLGQQKGGGSGSGSSLWWNRSWNNRVKITFDNASATQPLVNFPVTIKLNNTRIDYNLTLDAGQDIRFVDDDNLTELNFEIERWNEAGDSILFTKVPEIAAATTTDGVYLYYNNPAANDTQNASGVWSDYQLVLHLGEDPSGVAPQMRDSSPSGRNGTTGGGMGAAAQASGAIGFGLALDGADDYVDSGTGCAVNGSWTLSQWVYPASPANFNRTFMQGTAACGGRQIMALWHTNHLEFRTDTTGSAGAPQVASGTITDSTWSLIVWTFDGTTHATYRNGAASSAAVNAVNVGINGNLYTGRRDTGNFWTGRLDDIRLTSNVETAEWVAAQYRSQVGTFAVFGQAESAP